MPHSIQTVSTPNPAGLCIYCAVASCIWAGVPFGLYLVCQSALQ